MCLIESSGYGLLIWQSLPSLSSPMFPDASFLFVRILMDVGGTYVFRFLAIIVRL